LLYITHPDEQTAKAISNTLIEEGLVACANIFSISSSFIWEGKYNDEDEYVSLLKSRPELGDAIERRVYELHPYDVPCILRLGGRANEAYEEWIRDNTSSQP
jgi:periplasmic divalent cation tolerance protein